MQKGYKYRFYPTEEQRESIEKTLNGMRYVWNGFLALRESKYKEFGVKMNYGAMNKVLTEVKKCDEWLKECDSIALQQTLRQLDDSYKRFFKGIAKYPRFKSKKNSKNSYTTKPNIKEDSPIKIPKLGEISIRWSRELNVDKIGMCTISKEDNRYFISFNVEVTTIDKWGKTGESIGIDVGLKTFAFCSTGEEFRIPKKLWAIESRIGKLQRKLSRRKKGGANYNKLKSHINKLHSKLSNVRKDFQHKLSTDLVKRYDVIAVEDLNVKGMMENKHLARAIGRASFDSFFNMLKYKCEEHDKKFKKVNAQYTSQTCFVCGHTEKSNRKTQAEFKCMNCGHEDHADLNASKNILGRVA